MDYTKLLTEIQKQGVAIFYILREKEQELLINYLVKETKRRLSKEYNKIASMIRHSGGDTGVLIEDIDSEIICGVIEAINRYDHTKGASLISYCYIYARKHIFDIADMTDFVVRMPDGTSIKISEFYKMPNRPKDARMVKIISDHVTDEENIFFYDDNSNGSYKKAITKRKNRG